MTTNSIAIYDLEHPYTNPQLSGDALHGKSSGNLTAIGDKRELYPKYVLLLT